MLLAALTVLSGCSLTQPTREHSFVLVGQSPAKALESENTLEAAKEACNQEAHVTGMRSVTDILSNFRRGKADERFLACMKARNYEPTPSL